MTYVRTRLALDRLEPGQILRVHLGSAESRHNVCVNAERLGHSIRADEDDGAGGAWVTIQKAAVAPVG